MNTLKSQLKDHPFLRSMSDEHIELALRNAKETEFEAGDVLFREGEPANRFFLVQSGHIALESYSPEQGTTTFQTVGPGQVIGWSWLFPPFSWHFQARAAEPTRVITLDGGHLLVTCENNNEFGYDFMRRIAQLVIKRLQASRVKLGQLACVEES